MNADTCVEIRSPHLSYPVDKHFVRRIRNYNGESGANMRPQNFQSIFQLLLLLARGGVNTDWPENGRLQRRVTLASVIHIREIASEIIASQTFEFKTDTLDYHDKRNRLRASLGSRKQCGALGIVRVLGNETCAIAAAAAANARHSSADGMSNRNHKRWRTSWAEGGIKMAGVVRECTVQHDDAAGLLEHGELVESGCDGCCRAARVRFIREPIHPTALARKGHLA